MRKVTTVVAVLGLAFAACRPAPGSSGESSGSSSSSSSSGGSSTSATSGSSGGASSSSNASSGGIPDFANYDAVCRGAFGTAFCRSPACEPFDETACRAMWDRLCDAWTAEVEAQVDAGQLIVHLERSGACADMHVAEVNAYNQYYCADFDGFVHAIGQVHVATEVLPCANGAPVVPQQAFGNEGVCAHVTEGRLPVGSPCGSSAVCASARCESPGDGGCGICANNFLPGGLEEGQRCVQHDGGYIAWDRCRHGLKCDGQSGLCLPFVGAGETCGPGFKLCSPWCGYQCEVHDGGRGTCVPQPGEHGACGALDQGSPALTYCPRGFSCVGASDGGAAGQCLPNATMGEHCSGGTTYDDIPDPSQSGSFSAGRYPLCDPNWVCMAGPSGPVCATPAPNVPAATGAYCIIGAINPCAAPGDVCTPLASGDTICFHRGALGEDCLVYNTTCEPGLRCTRPDIPMDSPAHGTCQPPLAGGETCMFENCAPLTTCWDGVCTPLDQVPDAPAPLCR